MVLKYSDIIGQFKTNFFEALVHSKLLSNGLTYNQVELIADKLRSDQERGTNLRLLVHPLTYSKRFSPEML